MRRTMLIRMMATVCLMCLLPGASAEVGIDWGGKFFTNWLYGNDDTEFSSYVSSDGNQGHNGINSELELTITAHVSDYVEAGARIKNRYRKNYWATYWDNNGEGTLSGETNEANQYMKLRGVWARFQPPEWATPLIRSIHLGSSDLGMFNPWTVGRIRYIDRDNSMGTFVNGAMGGSVAYELARISLPSRWAGPGWSTRGKGYHNNDGFFTRDAAYAAAFRFDVSDRFNFALIGDYTFDKEGDVDDENPRDGQDLVNRFSNTVVSLDMSFMPMDILDVNLLGVYAATNYDAEFDYIERRDGFNIMPQKDTEDAAYKALITLNDPFGVGLNVQLEYFNIGEDFVSLMAARRESDVLITEGFEADDTPRKAQPADESMMPFVVDWGGWSGNMGQTPTLNVDNFETQFDEMVYQSIIGWNGGTLLLDYASAALELTGEYTYVDYNTNGQGRDMTVYPENNGFGAPDNAYNEYQERSTQIALIKGKYAFEACRPFEISGKVKWINDVDDRNLDITEDDYENDKMIYDLGLGVDVTDEIFLKVGYTFYDKEITLGGEPYASEKHRAYLQARYDFGGMKIGYLLESFTGEEQPPGVEDTYDDYRLIRSRAFAEVSF
ncbi:hypothetical protein JW905_04100 [bacterium]|nr:hypothetical protein [candidate division CSSED10-310 bacterium]